MGLGHSRHGFSTTSLCMLYYILLTECFCLFQLPYFMNELTLTELDMGVATPRILGASKPSVDHRGRKSVVPRHLHCRLLLDGQLEDCTYARTHTQ